MKKHYVAIPVTKITEGIFAGTNFPNAKNTCIKIALEKRTSVCLFRHVGEDKIFVGIAEFPYYLRCLKLDERDITWNGK